MTIVTITVVCHLFPFNWECNRNILSISLKNIVVRAWFGGEGGDTTRHRCAISVNR